MRHVTTTGSPQNDGTRRSAPAALCAALVVLLSLLNVLPCIDHCTAAETASAKSFATFLCDMPAAHASANNIESPHHHHTNSRVPIEPLFAFVGTIVVALALTARIPRAQALTLVALLHTPPTPPPRPA